MNINLLLVFAGICGVLGDVLCKYAAKAQGSSIYLYAAGASILWGAGPLWWTHIYKSNGIAETMALYNPGTLLALALIGVLWFREPVSTRMVVAYVLLFAAIWLMSSENK